MSLEAILATVLIVSSLSATSGQRVRCKQYATLYHPHQDRNDMFIDMNITIDSFYNTFYLKNFNVNEKMVIFHSTPDSVMNFVGDAVIVSWASRNDRYQDLVVNKILISETCGDKNGGIKYYVGVDAEEVIKTPTLMNEQHKGYLFELQTESTSNEDACLLQISFDSPDAPNEWNQRLDINVTFWMDGFEFEMNNMNIFSNRTVIDSYQSSGIVILPKDKLWLSWKRFITI